ncbi:hypothetical protein VP01_765g2 [Puccinia sorghi]|uniref:Retrovirus-related Pol polyprotein from transposon TNT 1-94-like beta-barrel domain-containing protein n=1 Tax=Puccinia sorghi TaxID=27349 RepID=A0A0L6UDT6_9BASI|nr:hypothetical protein VP01_765g2 [Puccinia sorghi]
MNASKPKGKTKREYCSGGKHNPKATHPEKDCWQLNDKSSKPAKAAQAEDSDGSSLISTGNGLCCTIKAMATIKLPNMCYLDSGASTHMFANKSLFKNYRPKSGKQSGKSSFVLVRHGEVIFKTCVINKTCMIKLKTTQQEKGVTVLGEIHSSQDKEDTLIDFEPNSLIEINDGSDVDISQTSQTTSPQDLLPVKSKPGWDMVLTSDKAPKVLKFWAAGLKVDNERDEEF